MQMHHLRRPWLIAGCAALAAISVAFAACGGDDDDATPTKPTTPGASATAGNLNPPARVGKDDKADLTGAGATFPAPLYQAWFDDYQHEVAKGVKVNYQSIGSGGGIQQFTERTVDFGASDAPMSDAELQKAPDAQHIPMTIGAVVATYNLAGLKAPLKLDGPTLAKIYLGEVKKWNDGAIAALNPGVELPDKEIQVVYRSDSSGTTYVFTDYLSKVSPDWKTRVGTSKAPNWPAGQGGKGNEGVTGVVKQTPNAIGYVELNYAITNKLSYADMKNKAGTFVTPTAESASAAAAGATIPDDYRVSIVDAEGDAAYPIASFTFLLVPKTTGKCSQQTPLADLLWWAIHDPLAADAISDLHYAPLPEKLLPTVEATIKSLKCDGGAAASLRAG